MKQQNLGLKRIQIEKMQKSSRYISDVRIGELVTDGYRLFLTKSKEPLTLLCTETGKIHYPRVLALYKIIKNPS